MKKIFTLILSSALLLVVSSCDSIFDNLEGDLSKMTTEDMISSEAGMQRVLANLYGYMPLNAFADDKATLLANASRSIPAYGTSVSSYWNYKQIRSINKFIEGLDDALEKGIINQSTRDSFMGEALAIRAYCYFASVRTLGGVPIVDKSLDNEYDGGENAGLYIKRSTEKETWDWVINQFQLAADLLPESHANRPLAINKYTALGFKARAALWAASTSKYWDRHPSNPAYTAVQQKLTYMEESYANDYYQLAIDAAKAVIDSGQYELAGGTNPSSISAAATALEDLFQKYNTREGLFGKSYDNGVADSGNGQQDQTANQYLIGAYLQGSYSITLNLADEYDYYVSEKDRKSKSGKIQTRNDAQEDYFLTQAEDQITTVADVADYKRYDSPDAPFALKDARFQAWVLYPGTIFRNEAANIQGGIVTPERAYVYPTDNEFTVGGKKYYAYGDANLNKTNAFYQILTDKNTNNRSAYSFMIRKYMDKNAYGEYLKTPWYDLRYAEILLTYAEAVVESGLGDANLAKQCLNDIRHRAGFTDDVDLTIENVIHEWKVEFAFENKWSHVLWRRRAYYNTSSHSNSWEEGTNWQKTTLIPMLDVSGGSEKYIFVRALPITSTSKWEGYQGGGMYLVATDPYYGNISTYVNDRLVDNNKLQ